jgi:hypothetical protein
VNAEQQRMATVGPLENGLVEGGPWYAWGPFVSERAWGTVPEDYSSDGNAWGFFPHDHARSRAYRWHEDGMAAICTMHQDLLLGLSLWNGRDPILKERMFGLTGPQGNHGEDVKEYWWYEDATPSHSWLQWRYHYPQGAFPYEDLVAENGRRGKNDREYELSDTGIFADDRYWTVQVTYAKAAPTDIVMRIAITNNGPDADTLHLIPTMWFRNTWSWNEHSVKPTITLAQGSAGSVLEAEHERAGTYRLVPGPNPSGAAPTPLFCDNETNNERLFSSPNSSPFPKDGINDHVISGAATVNPENTGTKAGWWYVVEVASGQTTTIELRLHEHDALTPRVPDANWFGEWSEGIIGTRKQEADEFYAGLTPGDALPHHESLMRSAYAGMIWGKQFYRYDVDRWLKGDPDEPTPPPERLSGRNSNWKHVDAADIISMPDPWEYPWFAAWDLAFHAVTFARIDPAFAKYQMLMLTREWFMHANGALPAYEWNFDDVNPPVHAWASLSIFVIDGRKDVDFLKRIFHKLLINFTWWVNRQDHDGNNAFAGGFLGLDNIGPIDRSHLPAGYQLEQSDGTAWMAFYCLSMLRIATTLSALDSAYDDLATKFFEHFAAIDDGITTNGIYDAGDGFFYDQLVRPDGTRTTIRSRSVVGAIPVLAATTIGDSPTSVRMRLAKQFGDFMKRRNQIGGSGIGFIYPSPQNPDQGLLAVASPDQLRKVLSILLDENALLSNHGIRSLSREHREHPAVVYMDGQEFSVDYEPGESTTSMYGGNSNWRGPVWWPINFLIYEALMRYDSQLGDEFLVEYPTGSGVHLRLRDVAADLRARLLSLWEPATDGIRPVDTDQTIFAKPGWGLPLFYEYFDGDTGRGLGASHQTGWTGIVAELIARPHHEGPFRPAV